MAVEIKKLSVPWQISIYSVYAESKIVRSYHVILKLGPSSSTIHRVQYIFADFEQFH